MADEGRRTELYITVKCVPSDPAAAEMLQRKLKLAEQRDNAVEIASLQAELNTIMGVPEGNGMDTHQHIPSRVKDNQCVLLPPSMRNWYTQVKTTEQAMKTAKEVTAALYLGAKRKLGAYVPVIVPHPQFLKDKAVRDAIVWKDMVIVDEDNWEHKPIVEEVLELQPSLIERDELDEAQEAVYQEMSMCAAVAEFMYYWSSRGHQLELVDKAGTDW